VMHVVNMRRGSFGWYALCLGCPEWVGHPELEEADARRHFRAHAAGVVSAPMSYSFAQQPAQPVSSVRERRASRFWPLLGGVVIVGLALLAFAIEGGAVSL
jgi:hypothetical protein